MSYVPPAKKTPNPPGFQPRPPKAKASGSKPPRQPMPKGPGTAPVLGNNIPQMLPPKPKAAGSASTTKKVKSFMKKYGQA